MFYEHSFPFAEKSTPLLPTDFLKLSDTDYAYIDTYMASFETSESYHQISEP